MKNHQKKVAALIYVNIFMIVLGIGLSLLSFWGEGPGQWGVKAVYFIFLLGVFMWGLRWLEKQQKVLEKSETKCQAVLDSTPYGILFVHHSGQITDANEQACAMLGYQPRELEHLSVYDIDLIYDRARFEDLFKQLQHEDSLVIESMCKTKSAEPFPVEIHVRKLTAPQDHTLVYLIRDISERKQTADLFHQIAELAPHGTLVLNQEGKIIFSNKAIENLFLYEDQELFGQKVERLIHPDHYGTFLVHQKQPIEVVKTQEARLGFGCVAIRKDASMFPVNIGTNTIEVEGRRFSLISVVDMTDHKKSEEELRRSQNELADFIENANVGLHWASADGTITWANKAELDLVGYEREEYIGKNIYEFHADRTAIDAIFQKLLNHETVENYEAQVRTKDGSIKHVLISASVLWENDCFVHTRCFTRDVTERILANQKLKELNREIEFERMKLEQVLSIEENLKTIFHIHKLIDFVVQKISQILEAQKCSLMLFDENTKELCIKGQIGLDHEALVSKRIKLGEAIVGKVVEWGEAVLVKNIETDARFLKKNDPRYKNKSFMIAPIKLEDKLMGVITVADKRSNDGIFSELDLKILCMMIRQVAIAIENTRLYRELEYLTVTDPLTNMYNYRQFAKSLDHEINRLKRYSGALSLMMIDVDNFKLYNDEFGHLEGDHLLKEIGQTIHDCLRQTDIACRYAGDEFVVILPETTIHQAKSVGEKIKDKIRGLELPRKVTLSIGVAQFGGSMNRYDLVLKADMALYNAKKGGKNNVFVCV